jgi:hypothetical protein
MALLIIIILLICCLRRRRPLEIIVVQAQPEPEFDMKAYLKNGVLMISGLAVLVTILAIFVH